MAKLAASVRSLNILLKKNGSLVFLCDEILVAMSLRVIILAVLAFAGRHPVIQIDRSGLDTTTAMERSIVCQPGTTSHTATGRSVLHSDRQRCC